MNSTEHVINYLPFTVRRKVKWGQCDPAGVVYTVVFAEYVMSTAELFYAHLYGTNPLLDEIKNMFGTPTRGLRFDFRRALWPGEYFDMEVWVGHLGDRTYELQMQAYTLEKEEVFQAFLTPVCIAKTERRSIGLPEALRAALSQHQMKIN